MFGVENLVIVETSDVILVMDRRKNQELGAVMKYLEKNKLDELL